jgi:HupE / UreJ protein
VGSGLYAFEIIFQCADSADLVLHNHVLFDRHAQHIDLARLERNGVFVRQLFTAGHEELRLSAARELPSAGLGNFVRLGFTHILRSLDRICFLVGVAMLVRRRLEWIYVAAGLALGYAASVVVSLNPLIMPRITIVEAGIGFMVVCVAAQMIARESRRPDFVLVVMAGGLLLTAAAMLAQHRQAALPMLGAAIFSAGFLRLPADGTVQPVLLLPILLGFLDGLVLPGDFDTLGLWQQIPVAEVLAFDAGAMLADALLMGLLVAAALLWRRRSVVVLEPLARDLAATALAGLGTFWLLSRLYS